MTILDVQNITKTFLTGNIETRALNNVSLQVDTGDFVALMGPSGCGKSTLLNHLGLLDRSDAGAILYEGQNLTKASKQARMKYRRDHIGFIFQGFNLIDEMSVLDNVALPLKYQGMKKTERHAQAMDALEQLEIGHRAHHTPSKLSGGQQQRAAIARAIVGSPTLILADEPTGNLDSKTGETIMDILKGLSRSGSTLVMVTHSQRDSQYADRIIHMLDGEIQSPS